MSSRFRLLAKWASGGMADVYLARQQGAAGFDKLVALKFLRDGGDTSHFRDMFLEEARTSALLNHPNIVQTFDAGELDGRLYMAMEFVHGETLGKFWRLVTKGSGAFPVELAVAIARDLAGALDYAHGLTNLAGTPLELVHRDVSPSNIIVAFDGMVKLLDFGVAKVATKLQPTSTGMIKGKFSYMSPEQARGEPIDHRSDVYSLGLVLWQMLTGRKAYDAPSDGELFRMITAPHIVAPSTIGARCSTALDDIVMEALAPRASERYPTAGDFATALGRYMTRYAAGFDATKLIRALMVASCGDRRERLAALIKKSEEATLDELERSMQSVVQPSASATSSQVAVPVSAPDLRRRSSVPLALLVLAGAATGGGYLAVREHDVTRLHGDLTVREVVAAVPAPVVEVKTIEVPVPPPPMTIVEEPEPAPPPPKTAKRMVPVRPRRGSAAAVVPVDAGVAADAAEPAPQPKPTVEAPAPKPKPAPVPPPVAPPVPEVGSLDATPALGKVAVDGSLPTSEVEDALERAIAPMRDCYRAAATKAKRTPALAIRISFQIDEARAAHSIRVSGDSLGLGGCVRQALSNLRTRTAPDVGTVAVIAQISFKPVAK